MRQPPRSCLVCGRLTTRRSRCPLCQQAADRERNARRIHYHGDYQARAKAIRAAANADPATRCIRCGQPRRTGDPWTAGHLVPGEPTSPLGPEHARCNYGAGATPIIAD